MKLCEQCGVQEATKQSMYDSEEFDLCKDCYAENQRWRKDCYAENQRWHEYEKEKTKNGHTSHCANRMFWGDGECECKREKQTDS